MHDYTYIRRKLDELAYNGIIDEYTKCMITDMTVKVVRNLAEKNEEVKKKVGDAMGGRILNYEAKDILNRGIAQGIGRGMEII